MSDIGSNIRQEFLNEEYYDFIVKFLQEELPMLRKAAGEVEHPDTEPIAAILHELICLYYTGGAAIDKLPVLLEEAAEAVDTSFKSRYARIVLENPGSTEDFSDCAYVFNTFDPANDIVYNLLGLCILFDRVDCMKKIQAGLSVHDRDYVIELLIHMLLPDQEVTDDALPKKHQFREALGEAIEAETKEESLKHLKKYLKGWYGGMRRIGWFLHDSHLSQSPGSANSYRGYWSFEAAAVAYLKDLDDTDLRSFHIYPKDLVDYARKHHPRSA